MFFVVFNQPNKEKTMIKKYSSLMLLLLCFKSQGLQRPQQQPQSQAQHDEYDPTPVVLQNIIGGVVLNFVKIATNPESDNIPQHLGGIFQAFANICNVSNRSKKDIIQLFEQLEIEMHEFITSEQGKRFLSLIRQQILEDLAADEFI